MQTVEYGSTSAEGVNISVAGLYIGVVSVPKLHMLEDPSFLLESGSFSISIFSID